MARKAKLNPALSTLYNAPDVRETRRLRSGIEELDATLIDTNGRLDDRLSLEIEELAKSISHHGQRVPILVRPGDAGRYTLVYGRRRLEACRHLGCPVRAIVAELDADQALKDQLLENAARRDLSFIERALIATALMDSDMFEGTEFKNKKVAEVLNLKDAAVSQMTKVVNGVDARLIQAIGPCPGIGRPRWETLKKALNDQASVDDLVDIAVRKRSDGNGDAQSDAAFKAVLAAALDSPEVSEKSTLDGIGTVSSALRGKQVTLKVKAEDNDFAKWLEAEAPSLVQDLHARWKRAED